MSSSASSRRGGSALGRVVDVESSIAQETSVRVAWLGSVRCDFGRAFESVQGEGCKRYGRDGLWIGGQI
ncbi:hypothetical protein TRAPUB_1602 [Trametes pubescens]|uniref:Uncharacterized protein n=1 Tax=Trametes pubescens TaxID=154538 RepID=A0A1M2VIZ5_TRAPU|nr:hypothetical protein TRAPUB_1602 [Trametes pubescens]